MSGSITDNLLDSESIRNMHAFEEALVNVTKKLNNVKTPTPQQLSSVEILGKIITNIRQSQSRAKQYGGQTTTQRDKYLDTQGVQAKTQLTNAENKVKVERAKARGKKSDYNRDTQKFREAELKASQKAVTDMNAIRTRFSNAKNMANVKIEGSIIRSAMSSGDVGALKGLQSFYTGKKKKTEFDKNRIEELTAAISVATTKGVSSGWSKAAGVVAGVMSGKFTGSVFQNQAAIGYARGINPLNTGYQFGNSVSAIMTAKANNVQNIMGDVGNTVNLAGMALAPFTGGVSAGIGMVANVGLNLLGGAYSSKEKQEAQQASAIANTGSMVERLRSSSSAAYSGLSGSNSYLKTITSGKELKGNELVQSITRMNMAQGFRSTNPNGSYDATEYLNIAMANGMSPEKARDFATKQGTLTRLGGPGAQLAAQYARAYSTDVGGVQNLGFIGTQAGMGKNAAASMAAKASQLTPGGRQALVSAMGGTFTSRGDRSFILKNILGLDLDTELNGGSEKSRKLKAEAARAIANGELISPEARVYEKYAQSFSSLGSVSPENRNVSGGKVEPSAKLFELIEASYKQAEKNMMTYADAIVHLTGITNTLTKTLSKLQGNMGTLDRLSAASGVTGVKGYRD